MNFLGLSLLEPSLPSPPKELVPQILEGSAIGGKAEAEQRGLSQVPLEFEGGPSQSPPIPDPASGPAVRGFQGYPEPEPSTAFLTPFSPLIPSQLFPQLQTLTLPTRFCCKTRELFDYPNLPVKILPRAGLPQIWKVQTYFPMTIKNNIYRHHYYNH